MQKTTGAVCWRGIIRIGTNKKELQILSSSIWGMPLGYPDEERKRPCRRVAAKWHADDGKRRIFAAIAV